MWEEGFWGNGFWSTHFWATEATPIGPLDYEMLEQSGCRTVSKISHSGRTVILDGSGARTITAISYGGRL